MPKGNAGSHGNGRSSSPRAQAPARGPGARRAAPAWEGCSRCPGETAVSLLSASHFPSATVLLSFRGIAPRIWKPALREVLLQTPGTWTSRLERVTMALGSHVFHSGAEKWNQPSLPVRSNYMINLVVPPITTDIKESSGNQFLLARLLLDN